MSKNYRKQLYLLSKAKTPLRQRIQKQRERKSGVIHRKFKTMMENATRYTPEEFIKYLKERRNE